MYTVKVPNELLEAHECDALVIRCMDFRYRGPSMEFLRDQFDITYDLVTIPGAYKGLADRDPVLSDFTKRVVEVSLELHHIKEVIAIHHATCGAYGIPDAKEEFERQCKDIKRAMEILSDSFPALSFQSFFAKKGDGEVIYVPV